MQYAYRRKVWIYMSLTYISLCDLVEGKEAVIESTDNPQPMKRRLIELGFAPGSVVKCVGKSPLGDPTAYLVKNTVIAIRKNDSKYIGCRIR